MSDKENVHASEAAGNDMKQNGIISEDEEMVEEETNTETTGNGASYYDPDRRRRADWEVTTEDWGPLSDAEFLKRERQRLARYKVMLERRRNEMDEEYDVFNRERDNYVEETAGPRGSGGTHSISPASSMVGANESDYAESFMRGNDDESEFDVESELEGPPPPKKPKVDKPKADKPKADKPKVDKPKGDKQGTPAAGGEPKEDDKEEEVDPFAEWDDSPFAAAAQQAVLEAEQENVSDQITPGMAKVLTSLFKNSKDLTKAKELADKYPPPKNVKHLLAPRMDAGFYRSDRVDYATKRADKELQLSQSCILASIVAILPMLELMVSRGKKDQKLAVAGTNTMDALRLAFYANTSVTRRRRQALRPNLDGRVARSVVEAEVSGESLFGEDVETTVREAKKADKLVNDLMGPERGRGRGRAPQRGRGGHQQRGRGRGGYSNDNNYQSHANRGGFREPQAPGRGRGRGGRGGRGTGRGGGRHPDDTSHHSPLDSTYSKDKQQRK